MSTLPGDATQQPSALGHLRVIEVGDIPASYATRLLADLGADVIKVEPPGGDPNRWLPPFSGNIEDTERSLTFINANTNKRSIVLDLVNSNIDRDTFAALLASADIFIEATPIGHLESLGFTDERLKEVHPGLATVSLTPFGRTGPYRNYKGSDAIANVMGGFIFSQGDDKRAPCPPPIHQAYQLAGAVAAMLGVAGARHRRRTGAGQRIDVSLQEALTFTTSSVSRYSYENNLTRRPGGRGSGTGANIYLCKDGRYVHFAGGARPNMWREVTSNWMPETVLAQPEWDNPQYRNAHAEEVNAAFAEFISQFDAEEFADEAQRRHLAAARLNTIGQFVNSEHVRVREWLQEWLSACGSHVRTVDKLDIAPSNYL